MGLKVAENYLSNGNPLNRRFLEIRWDTPKVLEVPHGKRIQTADYRCDLALMLELLTMANRELSDVEGRAAHAPDVQRMSLQGNPQQLQWISSRVVRNVQNLH
jgi:hypothetical protein